MNIKPFRYIGTYYIGKYLSNMLPRLEREVSKPASARYSPQFVEFQFLRLGDINRRMFEVKFLHIFGGFINYQNFAGFIDCVILLELIR